MTLLQFSDTPAVRHQVQLRNDAVLVDGDEVRVRQISANHFTTMLDGQVEHLRAVAHGDTIYVHARGRAWTVLRVDPSRALAAHASTEGSSNAPMPGVVVSVLTGLGHQVKQGDALLVIESMKLQMTISANFDGTVAELPVAPGQTFQRGAMLVRLVRLETSGETA